ncbi:MAG: hypothetical protein EON88_36770, partial [Brevundimonas sp.]
MGPRYAGTLMIVAVAATAGAPAWAAQTSGPSWRPTLTAGTDNRSKDASKSGGDPYVAGTLEWNDDSGLFYGGPAFDTIDSSTGSRLEVQAYAGVRPRWAGFQLDLRAAYKQQIDADTGADDDAWEYTANITRAIGPGKARLQYQFTPDTAGAAHGWTWIEARLAWPLARALSGSAAIGRREQQDSVDYTGWNAGVAWTATDRLTLDLRWYGTDARVAGPTYRDELVALA